MSFLGTVAIAFPLFGAIFAVIWSILYDYDASVRTACHVYNFLPSISAAIGGFTPQRYVWRICIALHAGLRFLLVGCYYTWLSSINMGVQKTRYQQLVKVAILCHTIENLALVTLTCVSSTENFAIHENSFIVFIVCSQVYMLLSCCLIRWTHKAGYINVTDADKRCLRNKVILFLVNLCIFLTSVYLYFRHNTYCEPNVYSWFAIGEYITVLSNIAFHGLCVVDFKDYSFTVLPTEELQKPPFKDK